MMAESGGNPNVGNSHAGAIGIMQFMPGTAKMLGINPKDPNQAIDGAARYLKQLYNQTGSWEKAVAAYNWGIGNVTKKGLQNAPAETRNYLKKVLGGVNTQQDFNTLMIHATDKYTSAPTKGRNPLYKTAPYLPASKLPTAAKNGIRRTYASDAAYQAATNLGLKLSSGYRDSKHNAAIGGSKTSRHMHGDAYDFAGSKSQMDKFAKWAAQSGLFKQVIWNDKDLISGKRISGHKDHVHVAWND